MLLDVCARRRSALFLLDKCNFSFMLLGTEISLEVIVMNAEYQSDYDNLNSTAAKAFMDSFELEVCFLIMV